MEEAGWEEGRKGAKEGQGMKIGRGEGRDISEHPLLIGRLPLYWFTIDRM